MENNLEARSKILLVMTCCWIPPARLAMALIEAGCEVDTVCPRGHVVAHVRSAGRQYRYSGFLGSIRSAIRSAKPDFVIPCDDYATQGLHALYRAEKSGNSDISAVIERSLGSPDGYDFTTARSNLLTAAAGLGICVPPTQIVADKQALLDWCDAHGLPAYVKADGTSGGVGVRLVHTREEASAAFDALSSPPSTARTFKRAMVDRDMRLLAPWLRRIRPVMSVQPMIHGPEANCAFAAWKGDVLACISVEVVERSEAFGPATVVRRIDNPQMLAAARKLATKFGLTGLYGLDFILEEETGNAYLLEMNPRSTQTSHLPLGPGRNPAAAIAHAVAGRVKDAPIPPSVTDFEMIALFPQEWKRDPNSEYFNSAFHDIPWQERELMRACVKPRMRDWKWWSSIRKRRV